MKTKFFIDKNLTIGKVSNLLFGSFIEHLGRAVYTGIYEPGHPKADKDGFRQDVIDLIKELKVPMVRYPGGNFLSGYNWEDGIGPKENRPVRLDYAWQTIEDNTFGTDEFMRWCKKAEIEPMMAVNLGTGTPKDAGNIVEYCNFPKGTYYSDLRIKNGHKEPYNIKYWCLGNEMDGPWQICHLNAEDYAKKALETAKIMRWVDPSIKLIACGSSNAEIETYPDWDRIVMETLYDHVDYISMHRYYWYEDSLEDFFASYHDMDNFIHTIKSTADFVKAKKRSDKVMKISFDEWNVWYLNKWKPGGWKKAPHILEDHYSLKDALVFSGLLNTLVNNVDRVEIAALAQLVNVIAPIFTKEGGGVFKQTIFYPFYAVSNYGRGVALKAIKTGPKFNSKFGEVNYVSEAVTFNEEKREISVFLVNYAQEKMEVELELRSFGRVEALTHKVMTHDDLEIKNTFDEENVKFVEGELPTVKNDVATLELGPLSYHVYRFKY